MNCGKTTKVALIGCGAVAKHFYGKFLARQTEVIVTGVVDLNAGAAEGMASLLGSVAKDQNGALSDADLAIVTTPPGSHFDLARSALEAGLDVLVEKPFVVRREHAEELCGLAEKKGRRMWVGHFRRFYPKVALARGLVASGVLGELKGFEAFEGGRFSWATVSDYVTRDPHGGVLLDTGSHTLDLALYAGCLDERPMECEVLGVTRDKAEPSHEFSGKFRLHRDGRRIEGSLALSRLVTLANLVRLEFENASLEFSVGSSGGVVISGPKGRQEVHPSWDMVDNADAFRLQLESVLWGGDSSPVTARHFVNQVRILDNLLNHAK